MKATCRCLFIADQQPIYLQIMQAMLRSRNCDITVADWNTAIGQNLLCAEKFELIIIFGAVTAPVRAAEMCDNYLTSGGKLITLGGPAFSEETYTFTPLGGSRHSSRNKQQLLQALDHGMFNLTPVLSFDDPEILSRFKKDTTNPDSKDYDGNATLSICEGPQSGKKCFKWYSPDFYINENFEIPMTMPQHCDAITFYAKAKESTRTVTVTLVQNDGMMFKTTFLPLVNWNRHLLTKKDFRFAGGPAGMPRPTSMPQLDFSKVAAIRFGHAVSHAYSSAGEQAFYIGEVSAAHIPFADRPNTVIPGMYPEYQYYPITNAQKLVTADGQNIISGDDRYILSKDLASISFRSMSSGLDKKRRYRFVPLIEAFDAKNLHCGYAAHMIQFINNNAGDEPQRFGMQYDRFDGAMLAVFTPTENVFYCQGGCKAVCDTALYMLRPVRLLEAGSREYAYFADQTVGRAGAMIVIENSTDPALLKNISVQVKGCGIEHTVSVDSLPEVAYNEKGGFSIRRLEIEFTPQEGVITTTLYENRTAYDRIDCEVQIYSEKAQTERRYAKIAKDGSCEIEIDGHVTRFFGVNYMPSGCIANEDHAYHEFYFARAAYDPKIIRTDLERIADIGMNAVSVFIYHKDCIDNQNFIHFVKLCSELGIYIDLGLRPRATPFNYEEQEVKEMIGNLRLADCDRIVAYDISWERYNGTYEPCYGNFFGRKSYDAAWREYLTLQYGSIEAAEQAIGYPLPRNEQGEVIGVSDDQLRKDGDHRVLVAVFRKFVDAHVRRAHYKAAQNIKKYDPYHILTARTGDASTIPLVDPGIYGYDYRCLAPGIDFFSPESYALSETKEILRQIIFTNEYSRAFMPNAVVQWKEFGKSIWCGSNFTDNTIGKEIQANFYRKFFDMLLTAHTGGIYAWWWAGGYRIGENSDFGIIDPDGSDRAVTKVMREYAPKFLEAPLLRGIDHYVYADRSENATGFEGYYRSIEKEFFGGWKNGLRVSIKNAGFERSTLNFDRSLPDYVDGMPESFFMDTVLTDDAVTVKAYNPSQCVWEHNVSLQLWDENRCCIAESPITKTVALIGETVFTADKADFERAAYMTLAADGIPFGEIIRTK